MTTGVPLQCAESLHLTRENGESKGSISLICSALGMIFQCARFVEDHVRKDPSLGVLSLAILAKTSTGDVSSARLFNLWGPRLPSDAESPRTPCSDVMGSQSASSGTEISGEGLDTDTQVKLKPTSNAVIRETNENTVLNAPISPSHTELMKRTPFLIDDKATSKCLALLMHAFGITSHSRVCRYESLSDIPASSLITAARAVMDAYKEKNGLVSKFVKYSSLLPRELRGRRAIYSPLILTRNNLGFTVAQPPQTVTLTVRKPDRNKKEVQFAMLATLLQVDPDGVCATKLQELAVEGLGDSGCSLKLGYNCDGPHYCSEKTVLSTCDFYDENNSVVSSGEVYPSVSFFLGRPIGTEKILIQLSCPEKPISGESIHGFQLCHVGKIFRVNLLDAFGNKLGSAIFVSSGVRSERWKGMNSENLEFSDATLVCDIQVMSKHKSEPYFFSEWSRFGLSGEEKNSSVLGRANKISKTLQEFETQGVGFWHRNFLEKQLLN